VDWSPVIAWFVPVLGITAAIWFGWRKAETDAPVVLAALGFSICLGVGLTFAQVILHGLCIDKAHLCVGRGDANMQYWFQSFAAIPIFWLSAVIACKLRD